MPLGTPDVLLTGNDAVPATSFTFTATTPIAGKRVLAAVRTARSPNPLAPLSFTAFGLAWSQVVTRVSATTRLTIYEAAAIAPVGTTVFVDVNDLGASHSSCSVAIVAHADDSTPSVRQFQTDANSGTAVGATLLAPPGAGNGVGCFGLTTSAVAGFTPEAGYTEALDYGVGTGGAARLCYFWRADNADDSPTATASASGPWVAVALELGEAPPAPPPAPGADVNPGSGIPPLQVAQVLPASADVRVQYAIASVDVRAWRNSVEVK